MKIEPRGKYPGVKIHLDKEECESLLTLHERFKLAAYDKAEALKACKRFALEIAFMIIKARVERPDLLEERTEEQIKAELEAEAEKSAKKLAAIAAGKKWQGIKSTSGL